MLRFSIIVPVHNAQRYLAGCLDSLQAQDFKDFEVICVDDGSTDDSGKILADYAAKDERFHVIEQENGGPSKARNTALNIAEGEFVCFLDADDSYVAHALATLDSVLSERSVDAVVFGSACFPDAQATRFFLRSSDVRDAYYPSFSPDLIFKEITLPYLRLAVRKDAIDASEVCFDESLYIGEDAQFLLAIYPRIRGIRLISDQLYRYRLPHEGSIMSRSEENSATKILKDFEMAVSVCADWKHGGLLPALTPALLRWFARTILYTALRQPAETRKELVALSRELLIATTGDETLGTSMADANTAKLVRIVAAADPDGTINMPEKALAAALASWRIREYGVKDLAQTAQERLQQMRGR